MTRLLVSATLASTAAGMALADSDAPYKSTPAADGVAFEAETESAKYGRLAWKGVIRNGKLDATATATMLRQGKPTVENWVVAASKP